MKAGVYIRKMTSSEYRDISQKSFEQYFVECALNSGESVDSIRSRVGGAPLEPSSSDLWYVIEIEEQMSGYCWLQVDFQKKEAFGYNLFLEKRVRGQGFGRQVMEHGKELLRGLGVNIVKICVFENNAPARNLYDSLGFREIRRVTGKGQIELEIVF